MTHGQINGNNHAIITDYILTSRIQELNTCNYNLYPLSMCQANIRLNCYMIILGLKYKITRENYALSKKFCYDFFLLKYL